MSRKRVSIQLVFALLIFITACGGGDKAGETKNTETEATPTEQNEEMNKTNGPAVDANGIYNVKEVGDKVSDEFYGTAELIKRKELNQQVDIPPSLKVTIKDMKIIKVTDPSEEFKFQIATQANVNIGDEFVFLQIDFTAENTKDTNVEWGDLVTLIVDQKQLDTSNEYYGGINKDFIYDEGDTDDMFYGNVNKDYTTAVIVGNENIKTVRAIFSEAYDIDSPDLNTDIVEVDLAF